MTLPKYPKLLVILGVTGLLGAACADEARGPIFAPDLADGKADAGDKVSRLGALGFGEAAARAGAFVEDLELHGYELAVRAGAEVGLEVTQKGSARGLDTTLYLYGPQDANGAFGTTAIAFDDDAGYGRLSKLKKVRLAVGGSYLVVVGTRDGRGRGGYRLEASCASGECAPVVAGACHPRIAAAIDACVEDLKQDPEFDSSVAIGWDLYAQCADVEVVAPARDELCAAGTDPLCALSMEELARDYLPTCQAEATGRWLDGACVFGERYGDLVERAEAMVVLREARLEAGAALTALEEEQIVEAVKATAYDDVANVAEAFEAVDDNIVNQTELWDASNRKAYTAYEVGAGDNSFGAIFAQGTLTKVVTINDGDFMGCAVTWGPERRRCGGDAECRVGRCVGRSDAIALGRCVDGAKDTHPDEGVACRADAGCLAGAGLVCAGAALDGEGMCLPAWMRGVFASEPRLATVDGGVVEATLLAYGLATVDMDVRLSLLVTHERWSDLRVVLANPGGTEVVVFDGARDAAPPYGELYMDGVAIGGFPGDESVNGVWRLVVRDVKSGAAGEVHRFGLDLTSRWD